MQLTLLVLALLAQTTPAIRRSTPATTDPGMVVRQAGTVNTSSDGIVSTVNSSTTLLGAGATFTGVSVDMLAYSTIRISVYASHNSATNGLQVQFSNDSTNWDFIRKATYSSTANGDGRYAMFNRIARYVRVVYTNGAVAQTTFRLQTVLIPNSSEFTRSFISEAPGDSTVGVITQSILYGKTGAIDAGAYVPVFVTPGGALNMALPSTSVGAFGELQTTAVSVPLNIKFPYNIIDTEHVTVATDGGTITADGGHIILQVADAGTYATIRSKYAARYIAGQGMAARFTFVSSGCATGQQQLIGLGDGDGYFFGCCPTCETDGGYAFGVLRRSSRTGDFWTPASQWNGAWGTTPPDITKGRPYQLQYQWLGYGPITYSIHDAVSGMFVVAHTITYAGEHTETSTSNPTLPLSIDVRNTTSNALNTLRSSSMAVLRQGAEPLELGLRRSASGSKNPLTTAEQHILSIRNRSVYNGLENKVQSLVDFISWNTGGAGSLDIVIKLRLNPNIADAGFADFNSNASVTEVATVGTYAPDGGYYSNGIPWLDFVVAGAASGSLNLAPYHLMLAPGDTLSVTASTSSGTPSFRTSISWIEEF